MKTVFIICLSIAISITVFSQNYPWERPLRMAWSNDGRTFDKSEIFQDSSGVPSLIRWKGDTLICAFQWFRQPKNSSSWDRVAVKFSYDNGFSWTEPTPIVVNDLPSNFQRPFDPTLTIFSNDNIRIYFSSSNGIPKMGLDSMINTYSAKSKDGIHFNFESNARVDEVTNRVIDPAVIYFKNSWHYVAPIGSPHQGAYHYVSPDGLNFSPVPNIPSDNMHNWTGNFMVYDTNALRFYGSGPFIWYNVSPNGGQWTGFVNTNIQGGDPTVVKISENNYLMVFVGSPYLTNNENDIKDPERFILFPNPVKNRLEIHCKNQNDAFDYKIYSSSGQLIDSGMHRTSPIEIEHLFQGFYFIELQAAGKKLQPILVEFVKE